MPTPSSPSTATPADSCLSIASILRCYSKDDGSNLDYTLLIIPVALEVIFSTSLIFTNWGSGRRHLLLVAEGWVFFALSLVEVLSHLLAARDMPIFRAIDQTIGALSFTQLLFYMTFLYAFIRGEVLPSVPSRIRRISRPYLLIFIPAIIAVNTVASFAGITYASATVPGHPVLVSFDNDRGHFVSAFFSAVTLALLTAFQASCFLFAFYRLIRAFLTQRNIETDGKDAAVLYRGIGWVNAGIKLGAIETVVGFVCLGIKIAFVRRGLRLFSRALLCIGVAKGIDATEDFKVIRDELETPPRPKKIRNLISNPRFSTFRQLSPNAADFHSKLPRVAESAKYTNLGHRVTIDGRPHPYASGVWAATARNGYAQSPINEKLDLVSRKPSAEGLTGMDEFSRIRAQRMSQQSGQRVTVYYAQGTPKLHLRLSDLDLPTPPAITDSSKSEFGRAQDGWFSTSESNQTPRNPERSRFTMTSRGSVEGGDDMADYGQQYRYGSDPYGHLSPQASPATSVLQTPREGSAPTSATHGHNHFLLGDERRIALEPPSPAYLDSSPHRFSGYSSDGFSAASAEIVDTPRRKLSLSKQKSTMARAVVLPAPSTKIAMALTEGAPVPKRAHHRQSSSNTSLPPPPRVIPYPTTLPNTQRPSPPSSQRLPLPQVQVRSRSPQPEQRDSFIRQSIIDDEGNVITVTAIAPEEEYDLDTPRKSQDRSTRALSGYSVRSVPETLQAVRELAKQFPGPPAGAVVANIGIRAPNLVTVTEESRSRSVTPSGGNGGSSSVGHTTESTDTEEIMRRRIPAEVKMKAKQQQPTEAPSIPLPPVPQSRSQKLLAGAAQFVNAEPIDPFDDDDTSYRGSELSPLSMSVKLRHPTSYISTTTGVTTPITPYSAYSSNPGQVVLQVPPHGHSRNQSREGQMSPGIVDFGTALGGWDSGLGPVGKRVGRPMGDLPSLAMVEGHRRSMSAKTRIELERERQNQIQALPQEIDLDELPDQLHRLTQITNEKPPLGRIKSIGKAPRKTTPRPTRGGHVRGSMHLQHLVIPTHPSSGRDVPMSAVGAGGLSVVSGVNAVGMNVRIMPDEAEFSATTTTEDGRGVLRDSEVLSIVDGGHVPIRFQGSFRRSRRKGSF